MRTAPVARWLVGVGMLLKTVAGVPELDALFPAGGQQGTRLVVAASGRLDPWPVGVWTDDPGLRFAPGATNGMFDVDLAPNASPGPHLIRVFTIQGASPPQLFVVGVDPEVTRETGAPNEQSKAELSPTPIPVTFNGRFTSAGASVVFPVEISEESVLRARFVSGALDSPAQGTLTLLKDGSEALVTTQDPTGRDFELRCPLPLGGIFQLRAAAMPESHTGDDAVFRLEVSADPLVRLPQPRTTTADSENVTAFRPMTAARTLAIPGQTRGVISPQGRQIDYSFIAQQNEEFRFLVRAGSIGSALMPLVRVMDLDRNVLAASVPAEDGELIWISRDDAEHLLGVTDARGEGGPTHAFQLEVEKPQTRYSARLEQDSFRLRPGETRQCLVRVLRPARSELAVHVSATGLPEGVTCDPVVLGPGLEDAALALTAQAEAKPAQGPFRVMVMTTGEVPPRIEFARFRLRPRHASPTALLISDSDQPWITVLP